MQMNEILNMQVRVFRKFRERHQLSSEKTLALFQQCDFFEFIAECYDLLHLSGDDCVLDDLDEVLRNRRVSI